MRNDLGGVAKLDFVGNAGGLAIAIEADLVPVPGDRAQAGALHRAQGIADPQGDAVGLHLKSPCPASIGAPWQIHVASG